MDVSSKVQKYQKGIKLSLQNERLRNQDRITQLQEMIESKLNKVQTEINTDNKDRALRYERILQNISDQTSEIQGMITSQKRKR